MTVRSMLLAMPVESVPEPLLTFASVCCTLHVACAQHTKAMLCEAAAEANKVGLQAEHTCTSGSSCHMPEQPPSCGFAAAHVAS